MHIHNIRVTQLQKDLFSKHLFYTLDVQEFQLIMPNFQLLKFLGSPFYAKFVKIPDSIY